MSAELARLVTDLLALACAWGGYPTPAVPDVEIVAPQAMPLPVTAAYLYAIPVQGYAIGWDASPARILVTDRIDLTGAWGRSILLHELMHACQGGAGEPAAYGTPLWWAREREAYAVQHRYLRASGLALRYPDGLPAVLQP